MTANEAYEASLTGKRRTIEQLILQINTNIVNSTSEGMMFAECTIKVLYITEIMKHFEDQGYKCFASDVWNGQRIIHINWGV